jgi:hypothetical protein
MNFGIDLIDCGSFSKKLSFFFNMLKNVVLLSTLSVCFKCTWGGGCEN